MAEQPVRVGRPRGAYDPTATKLRNTHGYNYCMTLTNAERQQRYRDSKRNAETVTGVTEETVTEPVTVTRFWPPSPAEAAYGTPAVTEEVVSTPTTYDPSQDRIVDPQDVPLQVTHDWSYEDDPDDPIIGLSALTARMATTRSGKLVDTRKLNEEQMRASGIWLGPDPANADAKAVKAPKKKW